MIGYIWLKNDLTPIATPSNASGERGVQELRSSLILSLQEVIWSYPLGFDEHILAIPNIESGPLGTGAMLICRGWSV